MDLVQPLARTGSGHDSGAHSSGGSLSGPAALMEAGARGCRGWGGQDALLAAARSAARGAARRTVRLSSPYAPLPPLQHCRARCGTHTSCRRTPGA